MLYMHCIQGHTRGRGRVGWREMRAREREKGGMIGSTHAGTFRSKKGNFAVYLLISISEYRCSCTDKSHT